MNMMSASFLIARLHPILCIKRRFDCSYLTTTQDSVIDHQLSDVTVKEVAGELSPLPYRCYICGEGRWSGCWATIIAATLVKRDVRSVISNPLLNPSSTSRGNSGIE